MGQYENIGLLFNKHYFRGGLTSSFDFANLDSKNNMELLKEKNKILFASKINPNSIPIIESDLQTIVLQTVYPGLFSGSGYAHESSVEGELKLGFFFDYTSGLPCLPGSSVKGVLRNAFTKDKGGYVKWIISELASGERKSNVKEEAIKIEDSVFTLKDTGKKNKEGKTIYEDSEFIKTVYEAPKNTSIYNRHIFFDAFPVSAEGRLLGNDYITPHKEALENPTPLQFMKVLPQVDFLFAFKLNDKVIPAKIKLELFKQILLDLGIGAKTNVGYGQFKYVPPPIESLPDNITIEHRELLQYDHDSPENNIFDTVLIQLSDHDYLFELLDDCRLRKTKATVITKFKKDAQRKIRKGKKGDYKTLEVGDKVKIRVNQPNNPNEVNFTVLPIWND